MINEIYCSALSFLRYFSPTHSKIAGPPTPNCLSQLRDLRFSHVGRSMHRGLKKCALAFFDFARRLCRRAAAPSSSIGTPPKGAEACLSRTSEVGGRFYLSADLGPHQRRGGRDEGSGEL